MQRNRTLLYVELALAAISGVMLVVTLAWRDWIEEVFGVDPDRGNGSLEWAIVVALALLTVAFGLAARRELKRLAVTNS